MLWAELCPSLNLYDEMWLTQNVTSFADGVFRELIKLKMESPKRALTQYN